MEKKQKNKQNDAPFVAFYNMHAVTFVLPDEMADMSIAGLQWFILIPQLNHTSLTGRVITVPNPIYIEKKKYKSLNTALGHQNKTLFCKALRGFK